MYGITMQSFSKAIIYALLSGYEYKMEQPQNMLFSAYRWEKILRRSFEEITFISNKITIMKYYFSKGHIKCV